MYLTKLMTKSEEKRFERDNKIYEEYSELMGKYEGLVTPWRIAGILAPKYGICQMAARNAIKRMEGYRKGEKVRAGA